MIAEAVTAFCIWRLFSSYLVGRIFTVDAVAWMERCGVVGLMAVLTSIVGRRVLVLALTGHAALALGTRLLTAFIIPLDLLEIMFCLFVLAVSRIFKAAVEIADDNASIV